MNRRRIGLAALAMVALLAAGAASVHARQGAVPDSVALEEDITYATADGTPLRLDLARPKAGNGPFPLVVCIHGGGWQAGSKADFRSLIVGLAGQGVAAASVQYRLAPKHPYPAQFDDVKAALAYLREHAKEKGIDPDRVATVGGSAGGHLALMLATDPALKVRAAVSLAGPTDLTRSFPEATDRIVRDLVGPVADPAKARRDASPIHRIGPGIAPILMIHGDKDEIVPYDQATTMRDALQKSGQEVVLITIPGGTHAGGGKPEDSAAAVTEGLKFLQDRLRAKP